MRLINLRGRLNLISHSQHGRKVLGYRYCTRRGPIGGHMHRRDFITIVGGAAAVWPFEAHARASPKRRLIAWVTGVTQTTSSTSIAGFLKGMRELGYVEGSDFDIVYRFSDGYGDRIAARVRGRTRPS